MSDSGAQNSKRTTGATGSMDSGHVAPQSPAGRLLGAYKQMLVGLFVGTLVVIGGLFITILPFYLSYLTGGGHAREPSIFLISAMCGALGAFCSALIRLYNFTDLPKAIISDQLKGLNSLHLFVYSLVPAAVGSIAAATLYLIFSGGILQGALFPQFACKTADKICGSFTLFMESWGPKEATDFAKVLVWGFVAGFAERFVPDTLERLAKSGTAINEGRI